MNFKLIIEAVSVSALTTIACVAAIGAVLWRKFQAERSEYKSALKDQSDGLEALRKQAESDRRRLAEAEQRYAPAENSAFPASLHLNRRGQVVQLHRRGETVRNIATALRMSQGEVKLMIKLYEMNRVAVP